MINTYVILLFKTFWITEVWLQKAELPTLFYRSNLWIGSLLPVFYSHHIFNHVIVKLISTPLRESSGVIFANLH
jgi:hypothetical protein